MVEYGQFWKPLTIESKGPGIMSQNGKQRILLIDGDENLLKEWETGFRDLMNGSVVIVKAPDTDAALERIGQGQKQPLHLVVMGEFRRNSANFESRFLNLLRRHCGFDGPVISSATSTQNQERVGADPLNRTYFDDKDLSGLNVPHFAAGILSGK